MGVRVVDPIRCCKCREYGWREIPALDIVYTNPIDGADYCVFHAPKEEKRTADGTRLSNIAFNSLFIAEMNKFHGRGAIRSCSMRGVIFPGEINFKTFLSDSILHPLFLQESEFWGKAILENIQILDASFDNAVFHAGADFSDSVFKATPTFHGAKFLGRTHFVKTIFEQGAMFIASEFESLTWFSESTFNGKVHLQATKADTNSIRVQKLTSSSLSNLIFSSLEVKAFSFSECQSWPQHFGYEPEVNTETQHLEELYRAMKQKAAEEHNQPQVSHWHYHEKLMALKRGGNGIFEAVMLWLYWATSGFGERAIRAGVWLLALVVLSFVANSIKEPWVWAELPGSAAAQYTMATIPFAKDIPGDGWVKAGRGFWQFLIAVQFTLFALAVRNRFRR